MAGDHLRPAFVALALMVGASPAMAEPLGRVAFQLGDETFSATVRTGHPALPEGLARDSDAFGSVTEVSLDVLALPDATDTHGRGAVILGMTFETNDSGAILPGSLVDFYVMMVETWPQEAPEPEFVWMTAPEDGAELRIASFTESPDGLAIEGEIEAGRFCLLHVDDLIDFDSDRGGDCRQGAVHFTIDTR